MAVNKEFAPTDGDSRPLVPVWKNIVFISLVHLMSLLFFIYIWHKDLDPKTVRQTVFYYFLTGLGITAGYHRWASHGSYKAPEWLQYFMLFFASGTFQGEARGWVADHKEHHAYEGTARDRYSCLKWGNKNRRQKMASFMWSHVVCWFFQHKTDYQFARRLNGIKAVEFQDRNYATLALLSGFVLPTTICLLWEDPVGGFLACWLRILVSYHATWAVNSVSHFFGDRPYTTAGKITSLATRFLINGLTSGGEGGDHAWHHRFQVDYRAGPEWWLFDPTKWFIFTLSKIGVTWDLRRAEDEEIAAATA